MPPRRLKNVGFGSNVLSDNINNTSEGNVSIGVDSLKSTTTGSYNITLGQQTLYLTDVGSSNVAVGYNSGYLCKTGTNNTFLGSNTQFDNTSNTYSNSTAIGYNCVINDSNKIVLGTAYENVCVPGNMMVNKTSTTYDFDVSGNTHCSDDMYLYGKTININKSGATTTVNGNVYVNGTLDMDNANLIGSGDISGSLTVPLGKLVNYPGGIVIDTNNINSGTSYKINLQELMPLPNTFLVLVNYSSNVTAATIILPNATENNKGQVIIFHSNSSYDNTIQAASRKVAAFTVFDNIYYSSLPTNPSSTFPLNNYIGEAIFQCIGTRGWVVIRYHAS